MKGKCLLIGGAGFIGTQLAIRLSNCGYDVTVCDRIEKEALPDDIANLNYYCKDYFEENVSDEIISAQDMIFLLISSVGPNTSMEKPVDCYGKDILRMIDLLDQMRRCKVKRLVFISSGGTIYGNQDVATFGEDMATSPINHYGIMKLTQEKILMMYNELYGMCNIIFRLANPYGKGQQSASGIGAVTTFLENIMNDRRIYIYGEGEIVRDYISIDDVTRIIELFFDNESSSQYDTPVFNIGTGEGTSIRQLVHIIEDVTSKKADIEYIDARNIDVKRNVLNISKIQSLIGDYQCMPLLEGVKKYYEIMKGQQ